MLATLAGCAARPAPDIAGRWRPVNRFADVPQEIPLQQAYMFYASPMDGTLRTMLVRWARDSHMTLEYRHPSDFTLIAPVARLRTPSLADASALLSTMYAAQRVNVRVEGDRLVVDHDATP